MVVFKNNNYSKNPRGNSPCNYVNVNARALVVKEAFKMKWQCDKLPQSSVVLATDFFQWRFKLQILLPFIK